jgi:integrase
MTRYPKSGKGSKWTIKEIEAIRIGWKGDTLNDSEGLSGDVRFTSNGEVMIPFRYAFRWAAKLAWHYCGSYPAKELADIRSERDKARELVKQGIDPRTEKIAAKIEAQAAVEAIIEADKQKRSEALTFGAMFEAWIADGVARKDGNALLIGMFSNHALPALQNIEVRLLAEQDLRVVYKAVIASGKTATADKIHKGIVQMMRWGEKRKPWRALLVDGNPAELVEFSNLLPDDYETERTRLLSPDEIRRLQAAFIKIEHDYTNAPNKYAVERPVQRQTQVALWLCLGTLCRIGELLMAEWKHVNFNERTWFIPKANTKDRVGDQIVYLSDFTLRQFKVLQELTGEYVFAFPASNKDGHVCLKSVSKQVGDRQVKFKHDPQRQLKNRVQSNSLVIGEEKWTPHDMRRTGATTMQELKISRDVINLCQNHAIGSKVDRSYLLHDYAEQKREAWQKLGGRIETVLRADNVVFLKKA